MAGLELCEPGRLYNILHQRRQVPRLAEPNYLCLLDARTQREYNESHIVTAHHIQQGPSGQFLVPGSGELGSVRHCVVYDCSTSSLDGSDHKDEEKEKGSSTSPESQNTDSSSLCPQNAEEGTAVQYARSFQEFTLHPVLVLRGGYRLFSACYPFLSTQKILWMPQELDNFQTYPVEILPAKLYMGSFKQACDQQVLKDLKIRARVNVSEQPAPPSAEGGRYLHIPVPDSLEADLFSTFATICHFIDAQLARGAVLVCSSLGLSRSSAVTMAYLMHSCQFSLKRAWNSVLKCQPAARPHRGFVKQLWDWERHLYGTPITDISEPHY